MSNPFEISLRLSPGIRAKSGADERFERILREHAGPVFGLAFRLTGNRADAEDLAQETMLKAWRGIDGFEERSKLKTWLFRILINAARDRARRRPLEAMEVDPGTAPDSVTEQVARRETVDRVLAEIQRLPPRQREALLLRARAGLSYAEIAEVLGIGEGAVKTHLVHARRKLAKRFKGEVRR